MAPTQHTTETAFDRKSKFSVKIAATGKTNTILSNSERKGFNWRSNYRHNIVQMENTLKARTTKASNSSMDVAVDVTGFARSSDIRLATKADPDETEYSSSFVDTTSGDDNGSGPSDAEVESRFYDDSGLGSSFDGFSSLFPIRKKKLTSHWRDFIRPIMWRCKWAELKMKELQLQAAKYNREISAHDRKRHRELDQASLEESGSKLLPFIHPRHRKKTMKRRKRKRVEDGTDIATHMSTHNLLSYFENKRLDLDGMPPGDDSSNAEYLWTFSQPCLLGRGIPFNATYYGFSSCANCVKFTLESNDMIHSRSLLAQMFGVNFVRQIQGSLILEVQIIGAPPV